MVAFFPIGRFLITTLQIYNITGYYAWTIYRKNRKKKNYFFSQKHSQYTDNQFFIKNDSIQKNIPFFEEKKFNFLNFTLVLGHFY